MELGLALDELLWVYEEDGWIVVDDATDGPELSTYDDCILSYSAPRPHKQTTPSTTHTRNGPGLHNVHNHKWSRHSLLQQADGGGRKNCTTGRVIVESGCCWGYEDSRQ